MGQLVRSKKLFDGGWQFHLGDIYVPYAVKGGMLGGLSDEERRKEGDWPPIANAAQGEGALDAIPWEPVDLPHDWCVAGTFVEKLEGGAPWQHCCHGFLPVGVGFYRKVFDLPEDDRGKKVFFEFDGVFRNSTVWVNGHLMGTHLSGYTSFQYDISDVARYGSEGRNTVLVRVDAREYEGWWYEGCGIYRHTWLTKTDRLHVVRWGTYVTTPRVGSRSAKVSIRTAIRNEYATAKNFELSSRIVDPDGSEAAAKSSASKVGAADEVEIEQIVPVDSPKLWSPEAPHLYKLLTEVRCEGRVVDTHETTFGIRTIRFTADRGFFLNGRPYPIKGMCNHQDFAGVGVALPDRLHEYKIQVLKSMGCNAYRCAHHPPAPELLDACDRLGMLVMDENRRLDSSPAGLANLQSMLHRDRNHPCIILWSMENEEHLEGTPMGTRIVQSLVQLTHKIDPTRPVTAAMNHGWNDAGYSDALDVVGYNYGHRNDQDVKDHQAHPQRKIVGSETNSTVSTRGTYEKDEQRGYCTDYPVMAPNWACDPERAWNDVVKNPALSGIFCWTGFDYRGEPTPYAWPCISSHFGVIDTCGFPKAAYHYYKSVWTAEPMVYAFPHWTWPGKEGQPINVWCYSNCAEVQLFLNRKSLGRKKMPKGKHLEWSVRYQPGELVAVAYRNRKPMAEYRVSTTGAPHAVALAPDRAAIGAHPNDVAIVRVSILDEAGRVVPVAGNRVEFSVSGPGKIIGVGNGDPSCHEPDKATGRSAFNGLCLVLVQPTGPGQIELRATSDGLRSASAAIRAES